MRCRNCCRWRHLVGENVVITVGLAAGAPRVGLSLAEVQQLILNLVLNARDAMPAGGAISLVARRREVGVAQPASSMLEFIVTDSGNGMDAKTAAHMFEPFYTTKAAAGTGTGLATVKRIAEQAGGTVCVDTIRGRGTRMTVRLPQIEVPRIEGESQPSPKDPPRRRSKRAEVQGSQSLDSENRGAGI
jgi:two-component system cell cycle sensor histidine kinase/response regulator CckA